MVQVRVKRRYLSSMNSFAISNTAAEKEPQSEVGDKLQPARFTLQVMAITEPPEHAGSTSQITGQDKEVDQADVPPYRQGIPDEAGQKSDDRQKGSKT